MKSNWEENFFTTAAACQTWKRCRHSRQTALELVFLVFVSLWKSFHWIVFAYSDYYFNYDFCIILLICWWPCWSWFIPQQLLESIQVHTWSWRCTPLSDPTIPPWEISLEGVHSKYTRLCVNLCLCQGWASFGKNKNREKWTWFSYHPFISLLLIESRLNTFCWHQWAADTKWQPFFSLLDGPIWTNPSSPKSQAAT